MEDNMDMIATAFNEFFGSIQNHYLAYLTAVSSIGGLSMALIQVLKDLFPLKKRFQKTALRQWMLNQIQLEAKPALTQAAKNSRQRSKRAESADPEGHYQKAEQDLILLATSGSADALYDLETDQLCGQINAAVQVVLDHPARYPELFLCLAAKADDKDVETLMAPTNSRSNLNDDKGALTPEGKEFLEARGRVIHMIQRNVDAFQIQSGYNWQLRLKRISFALSVAISFVGLLFFWKHGFLGLLLMTVPVALLSGFLAPVARDLVASIQSLRK
jgi:hypothetical protein